MYESNEETLHQMTAAASDVYTFAVSATRGTAVVDRFPRTGGDSSVVLAANPGQIVSPGTPDGSTMYVPVDGSILAVPVTGGAPQTLYSTTNASVVQVLVDGQTLYWSEGGRPKGYTTITAERMFEAPIADTLVPTALELPAGLAGPAAIENGLVTVTVLTENAMQLVVASGSAATRTLDTLSPLTITGDNPIAVSRGTAYYSLDGVSVREVPLDGSAAPRTIGSAPRAVHWIGVGPGSSVYYASNSCLYRVPG